MRAEGPPTGSLMPPTPVGPMTPVLEVRTGLPLPLPPPARRKRRTSWNVRLPVRWNSAAARVSKRWALRRRERASPLSPVPVSPARASSCAISASSISPMTLSRSSRIFLSSALVSAWLVSSSATAASMAEVSSSVASAMACASSSSRCLYPASFERSSASRFSSWSCFLRSMITLSIFQVSPSCYFSRRRDGARAGRGCRRCGRRRSSPRRPGT